MNHKNRVINKVYKQLAVGICDSFILIPIGMLIDILIIGGDYMSFIKILFVMMLTIITLEGEEMQTIKTAWSDIESYWKTHDKKVITGEGDTQKDIDAFEKKYNVALPQELIYSLKRNYQNSRQGRKALTYPWFGSNVGMELSSIEEADKEFIHQNKYSGLEDTTLLHIKTVFLDNLSYDNVTYWHKEWIPIMYSHDLDIVFFIDLDKKSKTYLKIIGLTFTDLDEVDKKMGHFRFALIADNYLEFMTELKQMFLLYQEKHNHKMEETETGKAFECFYYEKKFKLPKGFWTDEYRAEQIKKMGLK